MQQWYDRTTNTNVDTDSSDFTFHARDNSTLEVNNLQRNDCLFRQQTSMTAAICLMNSDQIVCCACCNNVIDCTIAIDMSRHYRPSDNGLKTLMTYTYCTWECSDQLSLWTAHSLKLMNALLDVQPVYKANNETGRSKLNQQNSCTERHARAVSSKL